MSTKKRRTKQGSPATAEKPHGKRAGTRKTRTSVRASGASQAAGSGQRTASRVDGAPKRDAPETSEPETSELEKGQPEQAEAESPHPAVSPRSNIGLPGSRQKPAGPDSSWRRIAAARSPAFDQAVPAYLLDDNYFFLDWNVAFDELVAQPLGLRRMYNHAEDFVSTLVNFNDVYERSKRVFDPKRVPLIDVEPLVFFSEKYGEIEFEKIAVQIADPQAQLRAWSVFLNITRADRADEVWEALKHRLERDLLWTRYALSYDKLLLNFDENKRLIDFVVDKLGDSRRCLDIGAGTGNGTLKLLQERDDREVWAIESNHAMIEQLIAKVERTEIETGQSYFSRLTPIKADLTQLGAYRSMMHRMKFDGAMLINVLYALEDKQRCLRDVFDLLRPGGMIVFSTPHAETDVDKLFATMRQALERKGLFNELRSNFNDARQRHEELDQEIHRDSKQAIHEYVEKAGFQITAWHDSQYVDAVVVVEAIRP